MTDAYYTLAELSREAGVPARTIRYYITRGLVAGPCKNGRDACYDGSHLERLKQIRGLQQSGLTLAEMGQRLGGAPGGPEPLPSGGRCMLYHISSEVTMMLREEISPWKLKHIHRAMADLREILNKEGTDHD